MWQDDKVVEVRRSVTERMLDDWEYESRRREAKREREFERAFDEAGNGIIDGVFNFISDCLFGRRSKKPDLRNHPQKRLL